MNEYTIMAFTDELEKMANNFGMLPPMIDDEAFHSQPIVSSTVKSTPINNPIKPPIIGSNVSQSTTNVAQKAVPPTMLNKGKMLLHNAYLNLPYATNAVHNAVQMPVGLMGGELAGPMASGGATLAGKMAQGAKGVVGTAAKWLPTLGKLASLKRRHDVTMYHSSAHDVDLEPRAHRLTNNKPAVFGTPDRALSLTFIPKWSDSDINLSQYGDDHMVHIEEQTPNAIRNAFEGKSGYLYHMKPHGFKSQDNLMKAERVLYGKPKVLKKEHIPNVYQALMDEERKGNVKIHKHVKTASSIPRKLLLEANKDKDIEGYVHPNKNINRVAIHKDGEVVGFFTPREENGYHRVGALYVQPQYRGQGLASNAIRDYMSDKKSKVLIEDANIASIKAHLKAGYAKGNKSMVDGMHWYIKEPNVKTAEAIAVKRDPQKWEQAKQEAKAKMGGKHSARAMQLAVKLYKDKGGTYSGKKPTPANNSMRKWTKQDWQTRPGTSEIAQRSDGSTSRYLPKKKWDNLSHKQQVATDVKKLNADSQYISNTSSAKVKGNAKYY